LQYMYVWPHVYMYAFLIIFFLNTKSHMYLNISKNEVRKEMKISGA
jgi:hypothetical protein